MTFRFSLVLSVFVFCAIFTPLIFAQKPSKFGKCPVEYGIQVSYNFGKNSKSYKTTRNIKDISPIIIGRIQEQLKSRVGQQFFEKLEFDFGRVEDFDDTLPLKTNDTERIDGYDFVFRFSDESKGLKNFSFNVVADAKGNLLADLALPDIASNPSKAVLVPCKEALAIAVKNGFPLERSSIYFIYDWDTKNFVWDIHDNKAVEPDNPILGLISKGTYRRIFVDASTGNAIKIFKTTIAL